MNKINLNSTEVLKKKFETELSGYSAHEVDKFLDLVLSDYKLYEDTMRAKDGDIKDRTNVIKDKEEEIEKLNIELKNLRAQLVETSKATDYNLYEEVQMLKKKIR